MQMLPINSPFLHTLQFELHIPIPYNDEIFPQSGLSDLVSAFNLMPLPAITTLDISLLTQHEIDGFEDAVADLVDLPKADFSPFLASHPNLLHLTLSTHGTELPKDIEFLPLLRLFKGSFEDAAAICARQRQFDKLVLTFFFILTHRKSRAKHHHSILFHSLLTSPSLNSKSSLLTFAER
ncbi:hypothetical protein MVEN_00581100 [Mycena venus]|uniref:Uncharacterized protein n=1 Tax=Mycena venus TaxID=2733690 RepID=A0A8H6YQZ3_9AGAR|nr:hypothetical protein MVEN_00581100 [Mycena venus]